MTNGGGSTRDKPRGERLVTDPTVRMPSGRVGPHREPALAEDAPLSVLFVDDEPSVLRSIKRTLLDAPFEVLTAFDATEALLVLDSRRIDVLVSDIDMPGIDGLRLMGLARRQHPTTLRMLLSGQSTLSRALQAINEGEVARFFPKPFDPMTFRQTLEVLGERIQRMRREGEEASRSARRAEVLRWMDATYPGATYISRTPEGEVQVDEKRLSACLEAIGAYDLAGYLRSC